LIVASCLRYGGFSPSNNSSPRLYLKCSTCCLEQQVESPLSLGTIQCHSLLPVVRHHGQAPSSLFLSDKWDLSITFIPSLVPECTTWSLCPLPVTQMKDSDPKIEHILSNPKTILSVVNYIHTTEQFKGKVKGCKV
jgi:hypothetical protein